MASTPTPLAEASGSTLAALEGICFDLDDTFSTDGVVEAAAYDALWRARAAGLKLVVVTGRPAGWCDFLCRMWPVDGVVGENGAFYFAYDADAAKVRRAWAVDAETRANDRARLDEIAAEVLREIPGARIASDQAFRAADLAVDFCEDVPPLPREDIDRIVEIFRAHEAVAKVSSIHVNGWYGAYDKAGMLYRLAAEVLGLDAEATRTTLCYVGDSPNDEPLFARFATSVGVANVASFLDRMDHGPTFITAARSGTGFAELVDAVLAARQTGK